MSHRLWMRPIKVIKTQDIIVGLWKAIMRKLQRSTEKECLGGQGGATNLFRDMRGTMRRWHQDKTNVDKGFNGKLCAEEGAWSKGNPVPFST